MVDIRDGLIETILSIITEAMDREDFDLLRGIQAFDVSVWAGTQGMENILSVIFEFSMKIRKEAQKLRERLTNDEEHYRRLGAYDAMMKRLQKLEMGEIALWRIRQACMGLRNVTEQIRALNNDGLVELRGTNIDNATVSLTPRWDGIIDNLSTKGIESEIFISALGKMIAIGIHKKGIGSLIPHLLCMIRAQETDGEISYLELEQRYAQEGFKYYQMAAIFKRDNKKDESIRLIGFHNEDRVQYTEHAMRAHRLWLERAREWLIRIGRRR